MGNIELDLALKRIREHQRNNRNSAKEKRRSGKIFLEGDSKILQSIGVRIVDTTSNDNSQNKKLALHSSYLPTHELGETPIDHAQIGFFNTKSMFYMPGTAGLNLFEQQMLIHELAEKLRDRVKAVAIRMPRIPELLQVARDEVGSGLLVDPMGRHIRSTSRIDDNTLYLGNGKNDGFGGLSFNLLSWESSGSSSRLFTTPVFTPK